MIETCDIQLQPGRAYALTAALTVDGAAISYAPALLTCRFFDRAGQQVAGVPDGFATSALYGTHTVLGAAGVDGDITASAVITPPAGAVRAVLALHRWRARHVTTRAPMQVLPCAAAAQPAPDVRLMRHLAVPAVPGETYEISARFDNALCARAVVVAVQFSDAAGAPLPPEASVPLSAEVGHFQYMAHTAEPRRDDKDGLTKFRAPAGAASIAVRLLRWTSGADLVLEDAHITAQSARPDVIAAGTLMIPGAAIGWCAFQADLNIAGPEPLTVALTFTDKEGDVLSAPAGGMEHSARQDNFVQRMPDLLNRHDGRIPVSVAFQPPASATAAHWILSAVEGGALALNGRPRIVRITGRAKQRRNDYGEARLVARLSQGTVQSDLYAAMARRGHDPLARLALTVQAGTWLALIGKLHRAGGGMGHATIAVRAEWFNADSAPLPQAAAPGFGHSAALGWHRSVCLTANDVEAEFAIPIHVPDGATYALIDCIPLQPISQITARSMTARSVDMADISALLDPVQMTRAQLIQALDIVEHTGDARARHGILMALASVDPATKGYVYRARILGDALRALDPDWLPETGKIRYYDADQSRICHLAKNHGDAALLADMQSVAGSRSLICSPLSKPSDTVDTAPKEGITETRSAAGTLVATIDLPGFQPDDLPPDDRASLTARLHGRTIARYRASLIHVHTGALNWDLAMIGLALSRAAALPLVHEWQPGCRADAVSDAQIRHYLSAAAATVVPSFEAQAAAIALGTPDQRLHLIPHAVPPMFALLGDAAEAGRRLRLHGLPRSATILHVCVAGCTCTASDNLSRMVQALPGAALVIVGQDRDISAQAGALRPDVNDDADLCLWMRAATAVVPPLGLNADRMIPIALSAMAQGRPVLMQNTPDAAALAGPDQSRAILFGAGPDDMVEAAHSTWADGDTSRAMGAAARRWICTTRLWPQRAAQYDAVYDAARANHRERAS
jgi:glycosyltransferase involved in cell wall biosynthesis